MQYLLWQHFSGGLHLGKTMRRPSYEWRLSSCQQQPHITMPIFSSGRGGSTVLNIRSQSYTFVLFIFRGCGMLWPTFQESNLRQQGDASETRRALSGRKLCPATVTAVTAVTVFSCSNCFILDAVRRSRTAAFNRPGQVWTDLDSSGPQTCHHRVTRRDRRVVV